MDCVIYIRWSSAEQARGSSLERQREDCRRHAAEKGWKVVDELVDDGLSAFSGRHTEAGALGRFVDEVTAGRYPDGIILLCEKLDRLSRQEPGRVFLWMMQMTDAGVRIATVDGGRMYAKGNLDMAAIIEVVVKAQLSHEESDKKSQRISAAWASKHRRLECGERFVMSERAPAWLRVTGSPRRFEIIEERAAVVRRIYEETAAGYGKNTILRNLNRDGVPPFGRADAWHESYVQKILRSPAVLGDLQLGHKPRGSKRVLGDVVSGYYPQIIDAELYQRARASMADRSRRVVGRGRRLVNLLAGLATCGSCGAKMTFRSKGRASRAGGSWVNQDYLVCDSYQRGRGCPNGVHFNYDLWFNAILDPIVYEAIGKAPQAPLEEVRRLEIQYAELDRAAAMVRTKAERAMQFAIETGRLEARSAWLDLTAEEDRIIREMSAVVEELTIKRGAPDPEEQTRRVEELRSSLDDEDEMVRFEARTKMMSAIHALITELQFFEAPGVRMIVADERVVHISYDELRKDTEWVMGRLDGKPF